MNLLRQEIFELETLNRHIKHDHEALELRNQIEKTINDNTLLHLGLWFKKNKNLNNKNKNINRQIINLNYNLLMRKPRMVVTKRKEKKLNLDVLAEVSGKMK